MVLYDEIGEAKIREVIQLFYDLAFEDFIIGHFFKNHKKERLVQQQSEFAIRMLGGPSLYSGRPLLEAHEELNLRPRRTSSRSALGPIALLGGIYERSRRNLTRF